MNKRLLALAALISAGLASICCIGPLVLTGLGLGGLGLAAGLTPYRPLFLGLTGVILAIAFYAAYRKRPAACADGSCQPRPGSRGMKAGLWAVAILAAAMAAFPDWPARVLTRKHAAAPAGARILALKVSGMDCAACTVSIKKTVEKVPGVLSADIDFDNQLAKVVTGPQADPQAVLKAVAAAGPYKAEWIDGEDHGKPGF